MDTEKFLVLACSTLVLNTFLVAIRLYQVRLSEMKRERVQPQTIALSSERSDKLADSRASDNYNNLFELPVLFYVLCAFALATNHVPIWLVAMAWVFVLLRVIHSYIQCTYNKVMHRFFAFIVGFALLGIMWILFLVSYLST